MSKQVGLYVGGGVLLVLIYVLGVTTGYYGRVNLQNYSTVFKQELMGRKLGETDLNLLWTVTDLVNEKYLGQTNYQEMLYGAIRGAVEGLNDPYSVFTSPTENSAFFQTLDGVYEGVGVEINVIEGHLIVITPVKGSPAERAGLLPKDEILAIDNESVVGMTFGDAINKMKGLAGTTVKLTVGREGLSNSLEIEITRETVRSKSD